MTGRRSLDALLLELSSVNEDFATAGPVQPRSIQITLPIDLRLNLDGSAPEIIGDIPLFLTRTAFDPEPAKLAVHFLTMPTEMAGAA